MIHHSTQAPFLPLFNCRAYVLRPESTWRFVSFINLAPLSNPERFYGCSCSQATREVETSILITGLLGLVRVHRALTLAPGAAATFGTSCYAFVCSNILLYHPSQSPCKYHQHGPSPKLRSVLKLICLFRQLWLSINARSTNNRIRHNPIIPK